MASSWRPLLFNSGPLSQRPAASPSNVGYQWFGTDDNGGRWATSNGHVWFYVTRGVTQQPMAHTPMHAPGGSSDLSGIYALLGDLPASGAVMSVQATVDFGFSTGGEGDVAAVTVAAPWIIDGSVIGCSPAAVTTADHDPQDVVVEGIVAYPMNIVPGVSFDIAAYAPQGSWGRYTINAVTA